MIGAQQIKKYLGLAPGWRFLIAGDYEDVWFDERLTRGLIFILLVV